MLRDCARTVLTTSGVRLNCSAPVGRLPRHHVAGLTGKIVKFNFPNMCLWSSSNLFTKFGMSLAPLRLPGDNRLSCHHPLLTRTAIGLLDAWALRSSASPRPEETAPSAAFQPSSKTHSMLTFLTFVFHTEWPVFIGFGQKSEVNFSDVTLRPTPNLPSETDSLSG